ncbi:UNVERIFIED_CONTAM: Uridine-cytidine kinase C, partial [Sesamum indicum]
MVYDVVVSCRYNGGALFLEQYPLWFALDELGSGKTSLAHKMANIVGCEVISLESYYKSEQMKDFKYDDFCSLDLALLSKVPVLDLENGARVVVSKSLKYLKIVVWLEESFHILLLGFKETKVMSQNEIMMTLFPMFHQQPHLVKPIREGNFIIQPKVDFDISISTVAGLLDLGYQAVACIEASAYIYQDGK